ncbi:hypothetical protein [Staphylococcus gallinarum]|uniref:hypothetical protein n=1 Tax=Staphylococcus gallinarum TaxID=1293 RepID=UPI00317DFE24
MLKIKRIKLDEIALDGNSVLLDVKRTMITIENATILIWSNCHYRFRIFISMKETN